MPQNPILIIITIITIIITTIIITIIFNNNNYIIIIIIIIKAPTLNKHPAHPGLHLGEPAGASHRGPRARATRPAGALERHGVPWAIRVA